MDGCRIEALHVVEGDRRVDQEAKQAGSHQVPEGDGNEEQNGPSIGSHPRLGMGDLQVFVRFETDENERYDLQGTERRAERQDRDRGSGKVQVVKRPDDPASEENGAGEYRGRGGRGDTY